MRLICLKNIASRRHDVAVEQFDASANNSRQRGSCGRCPSACPAVVFYMMRYLRTHCRDFNETWHKYSPFEWVWREKIFKVTGQGHSEVMCTFLVERHKLTDTSSRGILIIDVALRRSCLL